MDEIIALLKIGSNTDEIIPLLKNVKQICLLEPIIQYDNLDILSFIIKENNNSSHFMIVGIRYSIIYDNLKTLEFLISIDSAYANYALEYSASKDRLDIIMWLIDKGADIHHAEENMLRMAAYEGKIELVQFLINRGANVHALNESALFNAVSHGYIHIADFLIKNGALIHHDNDYILKEAVRKGNLEMVYFLLINGANVNTGALYTSIVFERYHITSYLIEIGVFIDRACLKHCIDAKKIEITKYLIKKGAMIRFDNDYPLITSITNKWYIGINYLLLHYKIDKLKEVLLNDNCKNKLLQYLLKCEINMNSFLIQAFRELGIDVYDLIEKET